MNTIRLLVCAIVLAPPTLQAETSFRQEIATHFPLADLPAGEQPTCVVTTGATVVLGTASGLIERDGERWSPVDGLDGIAITALASHDSTLFVARESGVYSVSSKAVVERVATLPEDAKTAAIAAGPGVVVAATDRGVFALRDGAFVRLRSAAAHCAAVRGNGEIAVGGRGGAAIHSPEGWSSVHPRAGKRSWALHDVRAVAYDALGRLWIASPQGLAVRNGTEWRLITGADGLPYDDFTCIAPVPGDAGGAVWLGTEIGAIRFDGDSLWEYRQGRRWLVGDAVRSIAVGPGGTAWLATDRGVSKIARVPMTLESKAQFYEDEIERRHLRTPYAFVDAVALTRPGDKSQWRTTDSDNDGLWTAMYGASQCFAYAVTRSPAAKQRARRAFEALRFLGTVTQGGSNPAPPGFVARTILPTSGHDPNRGRAERDRRMRETNDRLWKTIAPRWPTSADGKWYWKSDTSSDELDGHFFFYAQYYDLVADTDAEHARVRAVITAIADHLIEHRFDFVDHDGKPTRWARYSPQALNGDPRWWVERGLNSMCILSYLAVAAHVSDDPKYRQASNELIEKHHYAMNALQPKVHTGVSSGNQSDDEMAFMSFYNLVRYETNPRLRPVWAFAFHRYWQLERPELNPLFDFLYAGAVQNVEWRDAFRKIDLSAKGAWRDDAVDTLRRFPLDLVDWAHRGSHRIDIVRLPKSARPSVRAPRGHRPDGKVQRVDERTFAHWNHDPWMLDSGGTGTQLHDGSTFLLPYYLGRYHEFVDP